MTDDPNTALALSLPQVCMASLWGAPGVMTYYVFAVLPASLVLVPVFAYYVLVEPFPEDDSGLRGCRYDSEA